MTLEEIHAKLDEIKHSLHEKFIEDHPERVQILDAHLATIGMHVDAVHDEADKRAAEGN